MNSVLLDALDVVTEAVDNRDSLGTSEGEALSRAFAGWLEKIVGGGPGLDIRAFAEDYAKGQFFSDEDVPWHPFESWDEAELKDAVKTSADDLEKKLNVLLASLVYELVNARAVAETGLCLSRGLIRVRK